MVLEWKYSSELSDSRVLKLSSSLYEHLDKISFEEIREIKCRINFYLTHLKIISRKDYSESVRNQLSFLKRLNIMLENEVSRRKAKLYI
jgi:hypothetical protein